ncbi:hypothetical protein NMA58_16375 [Rhizobium sp. YTUHZ045]|uniref:hypothetical protein n=1 Tax=Rhizobium sp. YTUHZ045 TaxID=2962888 RepID=UPI003DA95140
MIVGRVAGIERDLHAVASLVGETIAGRALPFGFDKFAGSLSCKKAHEIAKARVWFRRIVNRHGRGGLKNHPNLLCGHALLSCHNAILADERTNPFRAKTGLKALICECEFPGIVANSGARHSPPYAFRAVARGSCGGNMGSDRNHSGKFRRANPLKSIFSFTFFLTN